MNQSKITVLIIMTLGITIFSACTEIQKDLEQIGQPEQCASM